MPGLIVGSADCSIKDVLEEFKHPIVSDELARKLGELVNRLELPRSEFDNIKQRVVLKLMTWNEAYHEVITLWVSKSGDTATLGALVDALRMLELNLLADNIERRFVNGRGRTTGRRLDDFLNSSSKVLVIRSQHTQMTATKLTETKSCSHARDRHEFARRLASGISKQVYSVVCTDEFTLSEALGLVSKVECKAILITGEKEENLRKTCSKLPHVTILADSQRWSHLTPATQERISGKHVRLSGKLVTLRELANAGDFWGSMDEMLDEHTLVQLLNDEEPQICTNNVPQPISYYVPRRISKRNLLRSDEIWKGNGTDTFVFTEIERHQLSRFATSTDTSTNQKRIELPNVRYMVLENKSDFDELSHRVKGPLHWIEHDDGKFYWVKSSGSVTTIQKAVETKKSQREYDEDQFVESTAVNNLPVILSDTPGMGKTMLLANFARKLVADDGEVVLFGVMSDVVKGVKREERACLKDAVVQVILRLGGRGAIANAYLNKALLSGETRINVMLDGFDEVRSGDLELAGDILKTINSFPSARLWVTTRPHLLERVENELNTIGHNILAFNTKNQTQCLVAYWKQQQENCVESRLSEYAKACVDQLHESMGRRDHDITGVPLQCMLVGELYKRDARNYANPDNVTSELVLPNIDIRSITDLYKRLVNLKLEKYFERYSTHKYNREQLELTHMFYSIKLLFPDRADKLNKAFDAGLKVQLEDLLNVGLLEMVDEEGGMYAFIHRTVAEFFAALFVVRLIEKDWTKEFKLVKDEFISCVMLTVEYRMELVGYASLDSHKFKHNVVMYFLDNLIQSLKHNFELSNDPAKLAHSHATGIVARLFKLFYRTHELSNDPSKLVHACATGNFTRLFQHFDRTHVFDKTSDTARSVFTDELALVSVRYLDVDLITRVCEMYEKSRGARVTNIRGITALHVAAAYREYSVVEYLLNSQGFRELVEKDDERIHTVIHDCVKDSMNNDMTLIQEKLQTLNLLCSLNPRLLEQTSCQNIHKSLLSPLITLSVRLLGTEHLFSDYFTVFESAARYLLPEDFHEMVSEIPAELLSDMLKHTNKYKRTPLREIVERFDPNERTLQLFKNLGADFNAIDKDGNSVITIAIRQLRSISTIDQLITLGAEWKHITAQGWGILHETLDARHFLAFQYFALKLTSDTVLQEQVRNATDWHGLGDIDLRNLGVDVNVEYGKLLFNIIRYGDTEETIHGIATILIQSGADIHATNWCDNIAFYYAVEKKYPSVASLLVSHGAVASQEYAYTILEHFIENISTSSEKHKSIACIVHTILEKWPNVLTNTDENGDTFLHHAVRNAHNGWVEHLIRNGADMEAKNKLGYTPREEMDFWAKMTNEKARELIRGNHDAFIDVFEMSEKESAMQYLRLIEHSRDPVKCLKLLCNFKDKDLKRHTLEFRRIVLLNSTIMLAVREGQDASVIDQLIAEGAEWKYKTNDGWGILHTAVVAHNFPAFQYFALKIGVPNTSSVFLKIFMGPSLRDELRNTTGWSHLRTTYLRSLIDKNKSSALLPRVIDHPDDENTTLKIVKLLIESGAGIHAVDEYGDTAFNVAVQRRLPDVASLLLSRGAVDSNERAYASLAAIIDNTNKLLDKFDHFERFADRILGKWPTAVIHSDKLRDTLMHHAIRSEPSDWVEYLIRNGGDMEAKNELGYSAQGEMEFWTKMTEEKALDIIRGNQKALVDKFEVMGIRMDRIRNLFRSNGLLRDEDDRRFERSGEFSGRRFVHCIEYSNDSVACLKYLCNLKDKDLKEFAPKFRCIVFG